MHVGLIPTDLYDINVTCEAYFLQHLTFMYIYIVFAPSTCIFSRSKHTSSMNWLNGLITKKCYQTRTNYAPAGSV